MLNFPASIPAGTYTMTYTATDSNSNTATRTVTVRVVAALSLGAVDDVTYDTALDTVVVALPVPSGGTTPYTSRVSGLPRGASYDPATHNLTLTSAAAVGEYNITYTASDSSVPVRRAVRTFKLTVRQDPIALPDLPTIANITDTTRPYDVTFPEAVRGVGAVTYTFSGLPRGITQNGQPRTLTITSGVDAGSHTITYTATDSAGNTASKTVTVVREATAGRAPTALRLNPVLRATVLQGQYLQLPIPTGGLPPYHLELVQFGTNSLPPGVTWDEARHRLDVAPDARPEEYEMNYSVYDSGGQAQRAHTSFLLTIVARPQIAHRDYDIRLHGQDVTVELPAATGGAGDHTYALTAPGGADVPAGLTLSGRNLTVDKDHASETIDLVWRSVDEQHHAAETIITLNIINQEAEEGRVIDPATYPPARRLVFDLSETNGQAVHYVPADHPWSFELPAASGGQGELDYHYEHPFTRSGRTLSSPGVPEGKYTVTIRVRDANLAWFEMRYLVEAVPPSELLEAHQLRKFEHETEIDVSNPVIYENELNLIIGAYHEDGSPIFYRKYGPQDGGFFFYRSDTNQSITLSDELRDELVELSINEPGSYVFIHVIGNSPNDNQEGQFPPLNVSVPALSHEFQRLDLQDQQVERNRGGSNQINFGEHLQDGTVPASKLAQTPSLSTQYILPKGIQSAAIAENAVTDIKVDDAVQAYTVDSYSAYDLAVINEVAVGTVVGVRYTDKGYVADPGAEPVGIMRTTNRVARTRGAVVQVNGVKRRVR